MFNITGRTNIRNGSSNSIKMRQLIEVTKLKIECYPLEKEDVKHF